MNKKSGKLICVIMILMLTISSIVIPVTAKDEIKVKVNGVQLDFDVSPQLIDDRTMVPMRKIFEALGATVKWYEEGQVAMASKGATVIQIKIDNKEMIKNGRPLLLEVSPRIIDDTTFVPVRAVAESFDAQVTWDEQTQTVIITKQ